MIPAAQSRIRGRCNPELDPVGDALLWDRAADPLARGCYSASDDDDAADRADCWREPVGRLAFAGGHTETRGVTVDAALRSGRRVAEHLANVLAASPSR